MHPWTLLKSTIVHGRFHDFHCPVLQEETDLHQADLTGHFPLILHGLLEKRFEHESLER